MSPFSFLLSLKESRTVKMNKLRMTGFECFTTFVIRRAKHALERVRPAISSKACLGIVIIC